MTRISERTAEAFGDTGNNDTTRPARVRRWSPVALAVAVFLVASTVLLQRAGRVGYNTDEGQFISTAQYFEIVFLDHTLSGPAWEETYWTLTQPPITRYIIGAAIWLSGNPLPRVDLGHRVEEVRGPDRERFWDPRTFTNERRLAEERRIERPSPAVLTAARVPMALLGAGGVLLLFMVGHALSGPVAGLVASLGLLLAPLSLTLLPRAHAEAPLLFFMLLGLYLALRAAARFRAVPSELTAPASFATGFWSGVATGLGAATKLPAMLGVGVLGAFAVWSLAVRLWRPEWAAAAAWRWSAVAAVVAAVVVVVVNPFLWPNPAARGWAMLQFRQQELVGQRTLNQEDAVPEAPTTRAGLLLHRTFIGEAPLARRMGLPLDAVLAAVGTGVLAWRVLKERDDGGLVGPHALTLAWVAAFFAGTAPNLALDWQRYYLPTVALGLVLAGVGAEMLWGALLRALWSRRRAPSSRAATPVPISTANSGSAG